MDKRAGLRNLRYLKWIGIVAPVVFLLALEAVHLAILDPAFGAEASNLLASGLATVAAVSFGLVLFFYIEDWQRATVRQNRDMGVVTAVSLAIQGELDVDQVMQAALDAVVAETHPTEASIHLPAIEPGRDRARRVTYEAPNRLHTDGLSDPERTVEIPLATGASSVGHLRLTVPVRGGDRLPSAGALRMVGNQIGAALQIGQLVGDLQRRKTEGHTLYQTLLQIGNQAPLSEIITTIVSGARDRLAADTGRMCLTESMLNDFQGQQDLDGIIDGGVACICPEEERLLDAGTHEHRCRTRVHGAFPHVLEASIWSPGESFGELWIAREHGDHPFTERDRGYLMTLAGLAAIAISAARLRERERQGATLAERDRIARELHDSLAQVLGSTHLRLRALVARPEVAVQTRTATELTDLADVAEEAYRDVREAILGLREASRPRGLMESLAAYLEKYTHQSGIKAVLDTTLAEELSLPTDSELQVIRVIQEALTNVRKHARAGTARIRIASGEPGGMLTIVIEDDGRGFDPSAVTITRDGGFGVQTMRERIELVGGTLRVDSAPGRGTKVIAMVPMPSVAPGSRTAQPGTAE
jgi:two-component system nitrate/nitrite sensor histidine kinase NarX